VSFSFERLKRRHGSLRRNYRGRKGGGRRRPPGAARGGGSGVSLGLARIAAIPRLIRLRKVKKKQNHAAAYVIAIVRLLGYYPIFLREIVLGMYLESHCVSDIYCNAKTRLSSKFGRRLRRVTPNKLTFDGSTSIFAVP
jgi:hypothetical protein